MKPKELSFEDISDIVSMLTNGDPLKSICQKHKVGERKVKRIAASFKVKRAKSSPKNNLKLFEIEDIKKMVQQGAKIKDIRVKYRIGYEALYSVINTFNIPKQTKKRVTYNFYDMDTGRLLKSIKGRKAAADWCCVCEKVIQNNEFTWRGNTRVRIEKIK